MSEKVKKQLKFPCRRRNYIQFTATEIIHKSSHAQKCISAFSFDFFCQARQFFYLNGLKTARKINRLLSATY